MRRVHLMKLELVPLFTEVFSAELKELKQFRASLVSGLSLISRLGKLLAWDLAVTSELRVLLPKARCTRW
jgi:hypothetical protein